MKIDDSPSPRLTIVAMYFGKLPFYFERYRESVIRNKGCLDVLFVTDQTVRPAENFHVHQTTLNEVRRRLHEVLAEGGFEIPCRELIQHPKKICDVRVLSRFLFEPELRAIRLHSPDDYIGYADIDLIYGNIGNFLEGRVRNLPALKRFEIVGMHGHLTAVRFGSPVWEGLTEKRWIHRAMKAKHHMILDEGMFRKHLLLHGGLYEGRVSRFKNAWPMGWHRIARELKYGFSSSAGHASWISLLHGGMVIDVCSHRRGLMFVSSLEARGIRSVVSGDGQLICHSEKGEPEEILYFHMKHRKEAYRFADTPAGYEVTV